MLTRSAQYSSNHGIHKSIKAALSTKSRKRSEMLCAGPSESRCATSLLSQGKGDTRWLRNQLVGSVNASEQNVGSCAFKGSPPISGVSSQGEKCRYLFGDSPITLSFLQIISAPSLPILYRFPVLDHPLSIRASHMLGATNLVHRTMHNVTTYAAFSSATHPRSGARINDHVMNEYRAFSALPTSPPSSESNDSKESEEKESPSATKASSTTTCSETGSKTSASTLSSSSSGSTGADSFSKSEKSMSSKAKDMATSATKRLFSMLVRAPGVLWFFLTHPAELRAKLTELKEAAKKEAHHYWMGSKLLAADLRTARQILGRTLSGTPLTRRERKQLLRTVSDVFRLVPMSIFILVPFMEFALPFALRLFPNMLPSTFQDSLKAEEAMKRDLKSRIAMAEFFQETLKDLAKEQKKAAANSKKSAQEGGLISEQVEKEETAASFLEFLEKARKGEMFPPNVIIKYSTYFKDELTLDNTPRMQLINMCKYMSIPPYGSDNLLRFQLRHKIRILQEDDQRILWEGIESLTKMELREACQERGMRSTGLSKGGYKRAMQQWLDLSVNKNVPISLLIMSRTFFLHEELPGSFSTDTSESRSLAGLADAISGLDKEVLSEVVLEVASATEKSSSPELMKIKLEILEMQNDLIAKENEEREAIAARKKAESEKTEKEKAEKEHTSDTTETAAEASKQVGSATIVEDLSGDTRNEMKDAEVKVINASSFSPKSLSKETLSSSESQKQKFTDERKTSEAAKDTLQDNRKDKEVERRLSSEEINAISQLVSPDPVSEERKTLERLKAAMVNDEDNAVAVELLSELKEQLKNVSPRTGAVVEADLKETKELEKEKLATKSGTGVQEAKTPNYEGPHSSAAADVETAHTIADISEAATKESDASTTVSLDGKIDEPAEKTLAPAAAKGEFSDGRLDKAIARLKSKVEKMVGKIEIQLTNVEAKIGDKLHYLDKDMDGILSKEEMAICLQSVLKRKITFEEAMAIASDMDENEDGFFSLDELSKWLETNKTVKLVEEGRDAEVDEVIATSAKKTRNQQENESDGAVGDPSTENSAKK